MAGMAGGAAAVQTFANLAGGSGPHANPYRPGLGQIKRINRWRVKDLAAYRRGGINDPSLDYLGLGPDWKAKESQTLRDESYGQDAGDQQALAELFRGYGGMSDKSGNYVANRARLVRGAQEAREAAMRSLETLNYRMKMESLHGSQDMYGKAWGDLTGQYNEAEHMAYQAIYNRFNQRKSDYRESGKAIAGAMSPGTV